MSATFSIISVVVIVWQGYCGAKPPYGLGYNQGTLEAIQAETRAMLLGEKVQEVEALRAHGRPTKEEANKVDNCQLKHEGGNGKAYLAARLKRDRPDLLDAHARGEFKSVRAAAKAAGFVKDESSLAQVEFITLSVIPQRKRLTWPDRQADTAHPTAHVRRPLPFFRTSTSSLLQRDTPGRQQRRHSR